jgi:hypothetical protein
MAKNSKKEETTTTTTRTTRTTPLAHNKAGTGGAVCAVVGVVLFILVLYVLAYSGRRQSFSTNISPLDSKESTNNKSPVVKEKLKVRKYYQSMFSNTSHRILRTSALVLHLMLLSR